MDLDATEMRHPVFAEHDRATARVIPVIVLEPTRQRHPRSLHIASVAAAEVPAIVDPLFREYGRWVARQLQDDTGIILTAADLAGHHEAFRAELAGLLGARGRLLVAHLGGESVGVGALKPLDDTTTEIKRMFVRPGSRGRGIGRALLEQLVDDAQDEHYETVRLETLRFMTAAQAMYRAFGFAEVARFEGSETAGTPLEPLTIAMEFTIGARPVASEARGDSNGER
jgi:ribosomal protein S18 acetylase RimI-like enzyme